MAKKKKKKVNVPKIFAIVLLILMVFSTIAALFI